MCGHFSRLIKRSYPLDRAESGDQAPPDAHFPSCRKAQRGEDNRHQTAAGNGVAAIQRSAGISNSPAFKTIVITVQRSDLRL